MARPIPMELPAHDPRIELQARLQNAPAEHAEALLAAYGILQDLHDRGAFDLMRGALESSDKIVEIAVTAAKSPQSVRGMRNLLLLLNMLGSIEPETLKTFTQTVPQALQTIVQQPKSTGLWRLIKDFFFNHDFRRGMGAINILLTTLGRSLSVGKS